LTLRQNLKTDKVGRKMEWLWANKDWAFSGFGVAVIVGIIALFRRSPADKQKHHSVGNETHGKIMKKSLDSYKNETHILFIDDDVRFKVAKILTKSGWVHTKLVKDAITLDDQDIILADILFIDVQGVGVSLGFSDEGLGLALAIKEKYPHKKVVIYSAETKGDRFHAALRKADSFLSKNADPYEFQKIVEDFTIGAKD
jgi:hypothetical protein